MNHLGIDVRTKDDKKLIAALKRLKSTESVIDGGMYHDEIGYSQVHVDTTMTEDMLDDWLYRVKHGAEYVGVFVRKV